MVSRHLVYALVKEHFLVESIPPQECCKETSGDKRKSAQSVSHTVFGGHYSQLFLCLFYKRLSALFQALCMVAKFRFGYEFLSLLSLNLKIFLLWKISDIHKRD